MKHLLALCIVLSWSGCKVNNQTSDSSGSQAMAPVTTGYSDCDYGIKIFNQHASGGIINDLKEVKEKYGNLPDELKALYPAARSTWNSALRSLKFSYTKDYQADLPDYTGSLEDWRNSNLNDDQKFFMLLTELKYGPYPVGSRDMEARAGWAERANMSKRLNAFIRVALHGNCQPVAAYKVKGLLDPEMLPQELESAIN
ncbi:hypothetical protein LVD17_12265 [Fulvivirga ulvae]|uniref:hypothetical protein n=1 Tax=Fulvivirga ulvae TaxID=2904245 RepID=UPI001F38ECC2|nr:hypothetical protein [Fulvivirga ulvae]UII34582.1 hypothetical protein LVD17_12265 [Fulvivirga ulvae]